MNITLYTVTDDPLVADKTLGTGSQMTGTFRASVDVLTPTFTIDASMFSANFNYAYLPDFGRYYYITRKRHVTTDLLELSLRVDVRKSFLTELLTNKGVVKRQENNYDMYLNDDKIPIGAKKTVSIYTFGNTPFKGNTGGTDNNRVIMQVLGG